MELYNNGVVQLGSPHWHMNWNMSDCVRNDIIEEKYQVTSIWINSYPVKLNHFSEWFMMTKNHFLFSTFQMERLFAGYLASDGDSNRLRNVFRIIPEVMESRLGEREWDIVINLSNDIFKVVWRNKLRT